MDWTGYPKDLALTDPVPDTVALAAFLGLDANYVAALCELLGRAQVIEGAREHIAAALPREAAACLTWSAQPDGWVPSAAELLDQLALIPDPVPDDGPVPLTPVLVRRLQLQSLPAGGASINVSLRLDDAQPWQDRQYAVPLPAVEVDPVLLTQTTGGRISVKLTLQDTEGE